jgi:hypothetical protein
MLYLNAPQKDIAALIEQRLTEATAALAALAETCEKYQDDLGQDASHFLRDAVLQAGAGLYALESTLGCEKHENKLALWIHPESLERYCERCAHNFTQCDHCLGVLRVIDAATRGDSTGHESCLYTEAT